MKKIFYYVFFAMLLINYAAKAQPECYTAFKTGKFRKGDTVEAYYFMAAVYPSPDKKSIITYISPILQINARKSDTIWSKNGLGLFRYGVVEFKDSIKSKYPELGLIFQGSYKDIVSNKYNPSRRIHIDPFCLNELRKYYFKEASKGKDKAVYFDEFKYTLSGFKDKDFDTLEIKNFKGDLSKPALLKEVIKRKKEE